VPSLYLPHICALTFLSISHICALTFLSPSLTFVHSLSYLHPSHVWLTLISISYICALLSPSFTLVWALNLVSVSHIVHSLPYFSLSHCALTLLFQSLTHTTEQVCLGNNSAAIHWQYIWFVSLPGHRPFYRVLFMVVSISLVLSTLE
jgi:hypothetical protein